MSKPIGFTPNQQSAIDFRDGNCLVSAGAGSGKTAVLTERVYWLIVPPLDPDFAAQYKKDFGAAWSPDHKDKETGKPYREPMFLKGANPVCDPDELLVLTFTKAAAFEMKDRVRRKLSAFQETRKYLAKMEQSDITNFDSFYLKTVNENHFELGLSNPVRILDTAFVEMKTKEFIDEVLNSRYEEFNDTHDVDMLELFRKFTNKDDESLADIIKGVLNLASLSGDENSFFANYDATYLSSSYVDKVLSAYPSLIRRELNRVLPLINYPNNRVLQASDLSYVSSIKAASNFDSMQMALANGSFMKASKLSDEEKDARKKMKESVQPYLNVLAKGRLGIEMELEEIKPSVRFFLKAAEEVYRKREAYMEQNSAYDFEGVARLMMRLLSNDDFREKFKKKYRFIMVDEYQDTSNAQEEFLKAVSSDNVFAVGDIKQSIYRFRKANPKNFAEKMKNYDQGIGGTLITLPDNFRSREEVLEDINHLFGNIMTVGVGGVDYRAGGHALRFGNHSFDKTADRSKFGIKVLNFKEVPHERVVYTEAKWIARDIAKIVKEGFTLKGKEIKTKNELGEEVTITKHECGYGDFAVLTSRKVDFKQYIKAFREEGVPLSVIDTYKVDNDDVILVFKSLLRILDWLKYGNFEKALLDSAFVGVSRSFLFRLDDDKIFDIYKEVRKDNDYSRFPFYDALLDLAHKLDNLTLEEIFLSLIDTFHVLDKLVELKDVDLNFQKIEKLANMASSMEENGYGLSEFMDYLGKLSDNEIELEIEGGAREKDAVVLMSDHASKGLQFPVCYFPELYKQFNKEKKSVCYTSDFGLVGNNFLPLGSKEDSTLGMLSAGLETAESVSERMRLFYVALTRAEEMIILLNREPKEDETFDDITPYPVENAKSFQGFFLAGGLFLDSAIDTSALPQSKVTVTSVAVEHKSANFLTMKKLTGKKGVRVAATRASHTLTEPIDPAILAKGNRLHKIMELTSFTKKELPLDYLDEKEIAMFRKVLNRPEFASSDKAQEFHEYEFYDEEQNLHGIIDMFLLYDDHIDLIDFKTKTIEPDLYEGQLKAYETYLARVFPKMKGKIRKYLLSITTGEMNVVN